MYTLRTGRIVDSVEHLSLTHSESRKDKPRPELAPSIPVIEPAQRGDPERT
jgi:hypothetical protein